MLGFDKQKLDKNYQRVFEIPFDSERKMMTTVHQQHHRHFVMVKGALECILPITSYIMKNGEKILFTETERKQVGAQANTMSYESLRVLAIAYKETAQTTDFSQEKLESDLILLGLT